MSEEAKNRKRKNREAQLKRTIAKQQSKIDKLENELSEQIDVTHELISQSSLEYRKARLALQANRILGEWIKRLTGEENPKHLGRYSLDEIVDLTMYKSDFPEGSKALADLRVTNFKLRIGKIRMSLSMPPYGQDIEGS